MAGPGQESVDIDIAAFVTPLLGALREATDKIKMMTVLQEALGVDEIDLDLLREDVRAELEADPIDLSEEALVETERRRRALVVDIAVSAAAIVVTDEFLAELREAAAE